MSAKPVPEQSGPVEPTTPPETPEQPAAAQAAEQAPEQPWAEPDHAPGVDDPEGRIRHEYSRFEALQTITVGGALAFTTGAAVPRSHPQVAQWVADGMVLDREATDTPA